MLEGFLIGILIDLSGAAATTASDESLTELPPVKALLGFLPLFFPFFF